MSNVGQWSSLEQELVHKNNQRACKSCKLVIDPKSKNLGVEQYSNLAQLETYAENVHSSLIYLQLEALFSLQGNMDAGSSAKAHVDADHVASHLGKATGLSTTIRSLPYQIRGRKLQGIPADIAANNQLSTETVYRLGPYLSPGTVKQETSIPELANVPETSEHFRDAVFQVAAQAHAHLGLAEDLIRGKPDDHSETALGGLERQVSIPAFYSLIHVKQVLKVLEEVNFDVWDGRLHQRPWNIAPQTWWGSRKLRRTFSL